MHCTFSTEGRFSFIDSALESRLWPYLGGIARENRTKALSIGGVEDHIHGLFSLRSTMSFAKAMQLIKGGSSKWIHDNFPRYKKFAWQEGYGAFSVSASQAQKTVTYIQNQREHHRRKLFRKSLSNSSTNTMSITIPVISSDRFSAVRFTDSSCGRTADPSNELLGYYHSVRFADFRR
jgi:REP element-mobilizing transposase RayT